MKTKDLIFISIFTALIAVGAFIKIPIPFCPITLQILFTTLAGVILGGPKGAICVLNYIIIGLIGVPIFTDGGGLFYILHPTFGFLIGFIIGAFITGTICHHGNPTSVRLFLGCVAGVLFVFIFGILYLLIITFLYLKSEVRLSIVLLQCILPMPGDILLCWFSAILGKKLIPIIKA